MGCMFKKKKIEYEPQAPEYQQEFAKEFAEFLSGQMGRGATPYPGQVAAPFANPFTRGAWGAMAQSPYGSLMGGMPFVPQQQQQPPQMPTGQPGGGQRPPMPMPRQRLPMDGGFGRNPKQLRRGIPFGR